MALKTGIWDKRKWADFFKEFPEVAPDKPPLDPGLRGEGMPSGPVKVARPPAADIPEENRGERSLAAVGECVKRICIPTAAGFAEGIRRGIPGQKADPSVSVQSCVCWSDVIVYSAAVLAVLVGAWSMYLSRR